MTPVPWIKYLKDIIDFLDVGYRKLFILAFVSWGLILIPNTLWEKLDLLEPAIQIHPWLYIVSIPITAWIIGALIFDLAKLGSDKVIKSWNDRTVVKQQEALLLAVSRSEKEILLKYYTRDVTTLSFDYRNGVVNGLIAKQLLYRASTASNAMSFAFDVNIQTWVYDFLKKHPKFFDGIDLPK